MESNKIQNIIVKYLSSQATFLELEYLEKWLENPENEKFFSLYIKTNYAIDYNIRKFNSEKIKLQLLKEILKERKVFKLKKVRQRVSYFAVAAVIVGIFATSYFFQDKISNSPLKTSPTIVNNDIKSIEPGTDKAILTLEDGSVVTLEKGDTYQTQNINSNGQQIVYKADERSHSEIAYNYLTIPRGGQFFIKLSDGTQVWLNSESKLKYPVNFVESETRAVELVYGEAYFDVSPSTEHKGSKFKVFNQFQEVEVLGTEFNIKAYKDEKNIYTTLVEGKVGISSGNQYDKLIPGQQSNLDLENKIVTIAKVDVTSETSWRNGIFSFRGKPLKDIMKVISRWYDVDVVFENEKLEDITFKGVLGKNQEIKEILETIKNLSIIKNYDLNGKQIILK
ncbi:MAG: DUF4974 domain-containing protein [Flavobacteriaceae bacterium]|nr:DUF4974 domain-containing protein [Flavobacteriaceae bacterium]